MRSHRVFLVRFGLFVAATVITATAAYLGGLRWNHTPSYPVGLWRLTGTEWSKGDLVLVDVPQGNVAWEAGVHAGYVPLDSSGRPLPLIKRVVAVSGDSVSVADSVFVNGRPVPNSEIQHHDDAGRRLQSIATSGVIPSEMIWIMSEYSASSFDSRYFGAVPIRCVRGRIEPVWTW